VLVVTNVDTDTLESSRDAPAMKRARVAALTLIGLALLLLALVLLPE
jgi:hypothetical protein